ncbi:MAG: alanine--glyoxylate aminotransferase family protein [Piscinibacter sp.]|uniref:aminotransferase class V-fold PLP-dependent enzyme n=1 Tax=Piscinibacter sp. TaxID=1903157 RepID=UPI00258B0E30|nr:aminotransferase class V-fold PLP-dependent enzyme [Piscinibacter sp.]MCW5665338.1 alanine--glyoxylate aminotransferase family protein [Piscinibacter sp.]
MPGLLPDVDPDGLLEYSVVYTDRALNHMSRRFQQALRDVLGTLKTVYHANSAVVVPGSGTYGMEAVARQFATDRHCLVVRNGWFSYRWTQIFEMGRIPASHTALKARAVESGRQAAFAPAPLAEIVETIRREKPALVFAPHVETSSGMILPDDWLRAIGDAAHEVGGLFVLDCIASGAIWVDMAACQVDVLVSAPQKGWSGPPCAGLVMLSPRARERIDGTTSSSFSMDLKKWLQIAETYESGAHAYHATMPTDSLVTLRDVMNETAAWGFEQARSAQQQLGEQVRAMLVRRGFRSVAAPGFQAPGVVVSYTDDLDLHNGKKMLAQGLQIAAGVPLACDEPADFRSFRIGLFGLDKLKNVERTVHHLDEAIGAVQRG